MLEPRAPEVLDDSGEDLHLPTALDDEIDLVAVMGPPVADASDVAGPGRLLEDFAHDEGLQQVPELAQRCRVEPPQPGRA